MAIGQAANAGKRADACNGMSAFSNDVQAQAGKSITAGQAAQLIAAGQQIGVVLGC